MTGLYWHVDCFQDEEEMYVQTQLIRAGTGGDAGAVR